MKELKLWRFILERLNKNQPVIFMCVLESSGSSPGRQGFKMVVANDGLCGSIGGGMMEYKFAELAKEKLKENETSPLLKKQIHNKQSEKNRSGMICSGEQTVFLYQIKSEEEKIAIKKIVSVLEQNKNGELKITPNGISFSEKINSGINCRLELKSEDDFLYIENTGFNNHLYIVGGGHCSLALSRLMSSMDFYIHVFDDRENLNTVTENTFAQEKKILKDYSEMTHLITSGKNNYVVVMTFGYRTDDIAVRSLINKDFSYFGVLGSKTKMEQLYIDWRKDNLPEEKLKNIFSPIGISINSQTPEEISVSIAAEIIKIKNALI
jgi:xanthine dehydrogenase accessory factor